VCPRILATDSHSHSDNAAIISGSLWLIQQPNYNVHAIAYIIKYPAVPFLVLTLLAVLAALLVVAAAYFLIRRWL
jgi:hypothetical protein